MLIAGFDCNSITAGMPFLEKWLSEFSTYVLSLLDAKVLKTDFHQNQIEDISYNFVYTGVKSYIGVVILFQKRLHLNTHRYCQI